MSAEKQRSASIQRMEERASGKAASVKDLISKYNKNPKGGAPKLRRFRRRRAGGKRRGSQLLAVPTSVTHDDPEVANSKSRKEQEILKKLEQQQAEFQKMLDEQRREKAELEASLKAAEESFAQAQSLSAAEVQAARAERARVEQLLEDQRSMHAENVEAAAAQEKQMEAQYHHTVTVRRKSAALVGKALLGGALSGASNLAIPEADLEIVGGVTPAVPSVPKPPAPLESDSESSSISSTSDEEGEDEPIDHYEDNFEAIMSKPVAECTPIELAARATALSEEEIPPLMSLIPELNQDTEGLRRFLHAPVPYEQGIIQCKLHRKGKQFYFHISESEGEHDSRFLMFAQDRSGFGAVNLMISMEPNGKRKAVSFLGKLRGNVLNTKYVAYDNGVHPREHSQGTSRCEKAYITYMLKDDAPRLMQVVVPRILPDGSIPVFRQGVHSQDLLEQKFILGETDTIEVSENKKPKWDPKRECYVLDFKRRANEASVKNFLLVTDEDPEHDSILFGKAYRDEFNVDVQYPMSFFQAFAICLSAVYAKSAPM